MEGDGEGSGRGTVNLWRLGKHTTSLSCALLVFPGGGELVITNFLLGFSVGHSRVTCTCFKYGY